MAAQLATGKITQTQYDAAVAYCGVLDSNAEYLKGLEDRGLSKYMEINQRVYTNAYGD